jgi:hypothetical protein
LGSNSLKEILIRSLTDLARFSEILWTQLRERFFAGYPHDRTLNFNKILHVDVKLPELRFSPVGAALAD